MRSPRSLQRWSRSAGAGIGADIQQFNGNGAGGDNSIRHLAAAAHSIRIFGGQAACVSGVLQADPSAPALVATGFADYISEGYDVAALHYLMKPVKQDKLFAVLNRAVAAMQKTERVILLPIGGEMLRVPVSQVQYVEAFSHTVAIITETDTIQVKMPISEVEKMLGAGFVRCHRSYLVGLKHIARLSKTEVVLDSGKSLPLSRGAAPLVHKAFVSYYTGEKDETV